jgi:hypothetical protein
MACQGSPLYVNPVNSLITLIKVLVEGKRETARDRLKDAPLKSGINLHAKL